MQHKKILQKQSGMTMLSTLIVIAIALFFIMLAIRMAPAYMTHGSIVSAMDNLAEDRALKGKSASEISRLFRKRLKINGIYNLDKKAIKYKQVSGGLNMVLDHNVTESVAGNVSVVMHFTHSVQLDTQ